MVEATMNVPQGDLLSAPTTTMARTAIERIKISRMATDAITPVAGPVSSRAIFASESPLRRTEAKRMMRSWTAPPRGAGSSWRRH